MRCPRLSNTESSLFLTKGAGQRLRELDALPLAHRECAGGSLWDDFWVGERGA